MEVGWFLTSTQCEACREKETELSETANVCFTMPEYNDSDLQTMQQYRAVIEPIAKPGRTELADQFIASLPARALDEVVDFLDPTVDASASDSVTFQQAVSRSPIELSAGSASESPHPMAWTISCDGGCDPTSDISLLQLALQEVTGVLTPSDEVQILAAAAIRRLSKQEQQVRRARLRRLSDQSEVGTFDTVTEAEVAFGLQDATLHSAQMVTPETVGMAISSLKGLIREMGQDPEQVLPPGLGTRPILSDDRESLGPSAGQTLESYFENGPLSEGDDRLSGDEVQTGNDLADATKPEKKELAKRLKHVKDCYFIEELYDVLQSRIPDLNCPKVVWKQAALDVQNGTSPLDSINDEQAGQDDAEADTQSTGSSKKQAGLDQFA